MADLQSWLNRRKREVQKMVSPGMLHSPSVKRWLGGVEPAWTLLDQKSFDALHRPPSPTTGPIRLAADLTDDDIQQSAVARNALVLLRAAGQGGGLKMTATGNPSRGVVADMRNLFVWPDFDKAGAFQFHSVVNEPDFLPLFFLRHIAGFAKLLRPHKGFLRATPAGRRMLKQPETGALQAILSHIAIWHLDLGYLGRGLHQGWPERGRRHRSLVLVDRSDRLAIA